MSRWSWREAYQNEADLADALTVQLYHIEQLRLEAIRVAESVGQTDIAKILKGEIA